MSGHCEDCGGTICHCHEPKPFRYFALKAKNAKKPNHRYGTFKSLGAAAAALHRYRRLYPSKKMVVVTVLVSEVKP